MSARHTVSADLDGFVPFFMAFHRENEVSNFGAVCDVVLLLGNPKVYPPSTRDAELQDGENACAPAQGQKSCTQLVGAEK